MALLGVAMLAVAASSGSGFPMLGLGTASGVRTAHVAGALELGFRFFDTAQSYEWGYREDEVGEAVAASAVPREEVFLQTKVHPDDLKRLAAVFPASLRNLRTGYVDALLMHRPGPGWQAAWGAMEQLRAEGKVRHLGVSNFDVALLTELLDGGVRGGGTGAAAALRAPLAVVQNWMDPFHQDADVRAFCAARGVVYQAFSSLGNQWQHMRDLGSSGGANPVLAHPTVNGIAAAHGVSPALAVLRWQQQLGVALIPASRSPQHQRELLRGLGGDGGSSFSLSPEQMRAMAALDGHEPGAPRGDDTSQRQATFRNAAKAEVELFWVDEAADREVSVGELAPGQATTLSSHLGHRFVARGGGAGPEGQHFEVGDGANDMRVEDRDEL